MVGFLSHDLEPPLFYKDMKRILIAVLLSLSLTFLSMFEAWAFPSIALNGTAIECGGGWGSNFLFFRNTDGAQVNLTQATAGAMIASVDRKARIKIKKLKAQLKTASSKRKKSIKNQIAAQNSIIQKNNIVGSLITSCLSGGVVASYPANGSAAIIISASTYPLLTGGLIYAYDGQFLGVLSSNAFNFQSIANSFGPFGNKFSSTSIFNQYGRYGGLFMNLSPFNQFSQTPPLVYIQGQPAAYITSNESILGSRIDPVELFIFMGREGDLP